ncbi:hypothetical protein EHS13_03400 [Paenibacillus psychroresistens]|uniref:Rhamnogalacturonase A/B/Epimerase-like pectate lyase domain-containing protein n=1 Tax=Paenibacillus psychroresistens TaxID=1778678 RepID=A0A6B8REW8_9BACL|nr:glycosyl hydrolase family 28-related protein [Paenibacillus psychroresistens]QGQ94022.1 hypothetical protein EHS13_03400 [Paenibacillus psychroresistens]
MKKKAVLILFSFIFMFTGWLSPGNIPFLGTTTAMAAPSGDILKLTVVNNSADTGNFDKYVRVKLSTAGAGSYVIASGDYLEYDVKLDGAPRDTGAVDIQFTDSSYLSSASGLYDQKGVHGSSSGSINDAANTWYHRKIKFPSSAVGKTISVWALYNRDSVPNEVYSVFYDNVLITDGGATTKLTAYANGAPPFQTVLNSNGISATKYDSRLETYNLGSPSGDVLSYTVTNNSTTGTNKYAYQKFSTAGAGSYVFVSGDYIEYDVFTNDTLAYGSGGLDIVNTDSTAFRDQGSWNDQYSIGGHPVADITKYATGVWFHRKLQVPATMIGKTVSYWMLGGENDDASKVYTALYDNVKVTNGATLKLTAYADGAPTVNTTMLSINSTATLTTNAYANNTGSTSGDMLSLRVLNVAEPDYSTYASFSNKYAYWVFSQQSYTMVAGDYLEYDVKNLDFSNNPGFAVDLTFTDATNGRDSGWIDQNSLSAHPSTSLQRYTGNQWYHRKIKVPTSLVGKTILNWTIASESNFTNDYITGFVDNVKITNGVTLKATGYADGNPSVNLESISNGIAYAVMAAEPTGGYTSGTPSVVTTTLTTTDVPIASFNVMNFGAVKDGTTDDTYAFQKALFAAAAAGGAVVYAPAGSYAIKKHLYIPEGVTLRGDWKSPDSGGLGLGTILKAYEYKDNANGIAFIGIYGSGALTNVSIWYPEQDYSSVHAYPWTIQSMFADNSNIINVTLINSYLGIKCGPSFNELQYINNVYGTVLRKGIEIGFNPDVPRIEGVKFKPDYWSTSGLAGAPSGSTNLQTLKNYTVANAEGLIFGRVDMGYTYDVTLRSFKTGLNLAHEFTTYGGDAGSMGTMAKLDIDEGNVGILVDYTSPTGYAISDSIIKASAGINPVAVKTTTNFVNTVGFNNSTIGGAPQTAVLHQGSGGLSFQNCTFNDWGYSAGTYAIEAQAGSLSVAGSNFQKNAKSIHLTTGIISAAIMGNTFNGVPQIDDNSGKSSTNVQINHAGFSYDTRSYSSHTYIATKPKPANNNLYVITASPYNAVGDAVTDNTTAIQNALNAAGTAGGGTVFVPAGQFKVTGTLSVPTGVELRGIFDGPHHTHVIGSALLTTNGSGNAVGTPFITLAASSGVRGLTIHYPNQDYTNVVAYPWAIRSNGSGDYVVDTSFTNAYQGLDFGLTNNADNHYIHGVQGSFLKQAIYVGKSPTAGWLENVHINPHFWFRSPFVGSPDGDYWATLHPYLTTNLNAFTLGQCGSENSLGIFVFANYTGLRTEAQAAGKCNAKLYFASFDASRRGIQIDDVGTNGVDFIGSWFYTAGSDSTRGFAYVGSGSTGSFRLFNGIVGDTNSNPVIGFELRGGTNVIQQIKMTGTASDKNFKLYGGTTRVDTPTIMTASSDAYSDAAITSARFLGGTYKSGFDITDSSAGKTTLTGNVTK